MLITIDELLTTEELALARDLLAQAQWADGKITAGTQSAQVKNNQQLPETAEQLPQLRHLILYALNRSALFFTAALPKNIYPPLFNRYSGNSNSFGSHVDNAMRLLPNSSGYVRTDISATLFLAEPETYEGGELIIEDVYGSQSIKLKAGSLVLYPSTSVHHVKPVTRGERLACFMWMQSMVRDAHHRRLLFDMDMALLALRATNGDTDPVIRLTGIYHNLLRGWAE